MLELARVKRNNLVHFDFHYHGAHYFPALFIDVGYYLIKRYADTEAIPELNVMTEYREEVERRRVDAEILPELSVDLDYLSDSG